MAVNIDIYIHGLAAFYRKDEAWKVVFLTEKTASKYTHKLFFRWKKEGGRYSEEMSLADKDGFEVIYNAKPPGRHEGNNYKRIFNLNSVYAHRGKLKLKAPTRWNQVSMMFPHSQLHTEMLTKEEYGIRMSGEEESEAYPIGKVAEVVKLTVFLETGGFTMKIPGHDDITIEEVGEEEIYTINLDNSCDKCVMPQGENDFEVYYEMVEDTSDSTLRFVAGRIDQNKIIPDGNCDPAVIDPPPDGDNE